MVELTESELKTSRSMRNVLSAAVDREPAIKAHFENISLTPFIFNENLPKIMVVTMPLELLINAKLQYAEIVAALKREFPKYIILTRREGEIPSGKVFTPVKIREQLISDLVFPAVVVARTNEVESREEMTQVVYLDSKSQVWTKQELLSIESLLCSQFGQNFKIKIFGAEI